WDRPRYGRGGAVRSRRANHADGRIMNEPGRWQPPGGQRQRALPNQAMSPGTPDHTPPLSPPTAAPTRAWRHGIHVWLRVAAAAPLAGLLVNQRGLVASSFGVVAHLKWVWLPPAVALESASMATFARMQRRLVAAGQPRLRLLPITAAVYAGNALAASVPL